MNKKSNVSRETFTEIFKLKATSANIKLSDAKISSFFTYYETLLKWNRHINLTRITTLEETISKHFIDSLNFIKTNFETKEKKICDLGSGAGFPGIPLSILLKETNFYLVEKVEKKASFLSYVKSILKLEKTQIINDKIENIDIKFDAIVMRAVNIKEDFLKELKKNLKTEGKLVLYLSSSQTIPHIFTNISEYNFSIDNISSKIIVCSF